MSNKLVLLDPDASRLELNAALEYALNHAKKRGADQASVVVTVDRGVSASARMGEVETVEMQSDRGVSITLYRKTAEGFCKGSASTSDIDESSLLKTVDAAWAIAEFTQADAFSGLPEPDELAQLHPDLDLYHPWELSVEQAVELAIACERAALTADSRISNSDGASVNTGVDLTVMGNSHGFRASVLGTGHSLSCAVLAEQGGSMQRDYAWSSARLSEELDSAAAIGQLAAQRSVAKLGARSVATGQYPVLFDRRLARGLFASLFSALSGGAQYRKRSFLLDGVGQKVLPEWLSVEEQPLLLRGPRSASFDNDGVSTRQQKLIADGVVQQYLLGVYSARKLGLRTTGNAGGARNMRLTCNAQNQNELMADMGTGFWVTELMGQGVNPVTGDYSRGASGFWVENGVPQYPVEGVTIAGNLLAMYKQLRGLSADAEPNVNIACGAALVDGMMVAGS